MKTIEIGQSQFNRTDLIRLGRDLRRLRAAEEARLAEVGLNRETAAIEYLEGRLPLKDYIVPVTSRLCRVAPCRKVGKPSVSALK